MDYIQLNDDNVYKIGIKDKNGKYTGDVIEIELEDVQLPLRTQEGLKQIKENNRWLQSQMIIINKNPDKARGKYELSENDEKLFKVVEKYYARQTHAYELILGKGAIKKILAGRHIYITFFVELEEKLYELIPKMQQKQVSITDKIKAITEKYSKKENDVME